MEKVVGIRLKPTGKVYDFDCGAFVLNRNDCVIVETEQGLGFGTVAVPLAPRCEQAPERPLKKVFRLASEKDFHQRERNLETEKSARAFCLKRIKELGLKMSLFSVESTFDANRLTFFFTSESRVDFRKLVKMLIGQFKVRIEMRQVGVRNRSKMCSGIGRCGREICCSAFMGKFEPVSIRIAKEQNLLLNPAKITGLCSRLMCCLAFENETYQALKEKFPKIGKSVRTGDGNGKVIRHNVICNRLMVRLDSGKNIEIGIDEIEKERE